MLGISSPAARERYVTSEKTALGGQSISQKPFLLLLPILMIETKSSDGNFSLPSPHTSVKYRLWRVLQCLQLGYLSS